MLLIKSECQTQTSPSRQLTGHMNHMKNTTTLPVIKTVSVPLKRCDQQRHMNDEAFIPLHMQQSTTAACS